MANPKGWRVRVCQMEEADYDIRPQPVRVLRAHMPHV
jgi:hypothetical protein